MVLWFLYMRIPLKREGRGRGRGMKKMKYFPHDDFFGGLGNTLVVLFFEGFLMGWFFFLKENIGRGMFFFGIVRFLGAGGKG